MCFTFLDLSFALAYKKLQECNKCSRAAQKRGFARASDFSFAQFFSSMSYRAKRVARSRVYLHGFQRTKHRKIIVRGNGRVCLNLFVLSFVSSDKKLQECNKCSRAAQKRGFARASDFSFAQFFSSMSYRAKRVARSRVYLHGFQRTKHRKIIVRGNGRVCLNLFVLSFVSSDRKLQECNKCSRAAQKRGFARASDYIHEKSFAS